MSLQDRILELLTHGPLASKSLYWLLREHSHEAVDAAVKALRESGQIAVQGGYFRCPSAPIVATNVPDSLARGAIAVKRRNRTAAAFGAPLTLREVEIADLAATGRRTPGLAAELGITVKTLYQALGVIYAKLGVRGRKELAAAMVKREGRREEVAA